MSFPPNVPPYDRSAQRRRFLSKGIKATGFDPGAQRPLPWQHRGVYRPGHAPRPHLHSGLPRSGTGTILKTHKPYRPFIVYPPSKRSPLSQYLHKLYSESLTPLQRYLRDLSLDKKYGP